MKNFKIKFCNFFYFEFNFIRKNLDFSKFFYRFYQNITIFTLDNDFKVKWIVEINPDFTYKISYQGQIVNIKDTKDYEILPTQIQCYTHLMTLYDYLLKCD